MSQQLARQQDCQTGENFVLEVKRKQQRPTLQELDELGKRLMLSQFRAKEA